MNCEQCGAPMVVEQGKNFFHCQYCGSFQFPVPNQDGVALLDQVTPYTCPECAVPLVTALILDIRVLACPNCRGNFIPQSKLLPILRQMQPDPADKDESPATPDRKELNRKVACPTCRKPMEAYPYGGPGNVIIQGCAGCQAVWLDSGELASIVRANAKMYHQPPEELGAKKRHVEF